MTRVADLLAELVAIPTQLAGPDCISGDEHKLCQHAAPLPADAGADEVLVGRGPRSDGKLGAYVLARWGTPRRIINAHVDTVPANAGWSRDQWKPHIEGGRLYGLGACDTKAAIAATLVALADHEPANAGVLFSGDEEAGSAIMESFLASGDASDVKQAVVCEPTARTAGTTPRGVLGPEAALEGHVGHCPNAVFKPKPLVQHAKPAIALDELGRARLHDGPPGMTGTCMN